MAKIKTVNEVRVDPVSYAPIAKDGVATPFFATQWARLVDLVTELRSLIADVVTLENAEIIAGSGLTGGGQLKDAPLTISADAQAILDQISTTRGVVLFRGAADWQALAPGTAGEVLSTGGVGADPSWASAAAALEIQDNNVPIASDVGVINFEGGVSVVDDGGGQVTVTITGGGGSGGWELISSKDFSASPAATWDVNVTDYTEVMVIIRQVTAAAAGFRYVRVSTNGGSTFYSTSGDYYSAVNTGAGANADAFGLHSASNAGARTGALLISGLDVPNTPKVGSMASQNGTNDESVRLFVADLVNPINYIRLGNTAAGNLTGGTAFVLGRKPGSGGGATAFTDLTDVPGTYAGAALQGVRVKSDETGLEFSDEFVTPVLKTKSGFLLDLGNGSFLDVGD